MRKLICLSCFLFAIVGLGAVALSQSTNPPLSTQTTSLIKFDWDGKFADGSAGAAATDVEIEFVPSGGGAATTYAQALTVVAGENSVGAAVAVTGLADGAYTARARVRGDNGVWSAFSTPITVTVDNRAPAAPVRIRVEVSVTVNVEFETE